MKDLSNMACITQEQEVGTDNATSLEDFLRFDGLTEDATTGAVKIDFSVRNLITGKFVSVSIERATATSEKIFGLIQRNNGIAISLAKIDTLILGGAEAFLFSHYQKYGSCQGAVNVCHNHLGWNKDLLFAADALYDVSGAIDSQYLGKYDVAPQGSLQTLVDGLKKLQLTAEAQALMGVGASATILPWLRIRHGIAMENPIIHLLGTSTTGKTTVAKMIASFGGNPEGENGFFRTFLATENAVIQQVGQNWGYPLVFDEFSVTGGKHIYDSMVYSLSNGFSKVRLKAGGAQISEAIEFHTAFITTGEKSILSKCSQNDGIRARLFELDNIMWTESAEQAEALKALVAQNYGWITPLIAQALLQKGDHYFKLFQDFKQRFSNRMKEDEIRFPLMDRVLGFPAVFRLGVEILRDTLGTDFDVEGIETFLYNHFLVAGAEQDSLGKRAYDIVLANIARHPERYKDISCDTAFLNLSDYSGFIISGCKKGYSHAVLLYPEVFEQILEEKGFKSPKLVLKDMHARGLLRTQGSNQHYLYKSVNGINTKFVAVCFNMDDSLNDELFG